MVWSGLCFIPQSSAAHGERTPNAIQRRGLVVRSGLCFILNRGRGNPDVSTTPVTDPPVSGATTTVNELLGQVGSCVQQEMRRAAAERSANPVTEPRDTPLSMAETRDVQPAVSTQGNTSTAGSYC